MTDAYGRAAFRTRFMAALKPTHDSIEGLRGGVCREPMTLVLAAAPPAPSPPPQTAADREFDHVRSVALSRIQAEHDRRRAGEDAAAMILEAFATFEPSDRNPSRAPPHGSDAEERAADMILSFMPKQRS